jgi:hypothetical protein
MKTFLIFLASFLVCFAAIADIPISGTITNIGNLAPVVDVSGVGGLTNATVANATSAVMALNSLSVSNNYAYFQLGGTGAYGNDVFRILGANGTFIESSSNNVFELRNSNSVLNAYYTLDKFGVDTGEIYTNGRFVSMTMDLHSNINFFVPPGGAFNFVNGTISGSSLKPGTVSSNALDAATEALLLAGGGSGINGLLNKTNFNTLKTKYADAVNGSDSNDGSADKPWLTDNYAQTHTPAGWTLALAPGSYGVTNCGINYYLQAGAFLTIQPQTGTNKVSGLGDVATLSVAVTNYSAAFDVNSVSWNSDSVCAHQSNVLVTVHAKTFTGWCCGDGGAVFNVFCDTATITDANNLLTLKLFATGSVLMSDQDGDGYFLTSNSIVSSPTVNFNGIATEFSDSQPFTLDCSVWNNLSGNDPNFPAGMVLAKAVVFQPPVTIPNATGIYQIGTNLFLRGAKVPNTNDLVSAAGSIVTIGAQPPVLVGQLLAFIRTNEDGQSVTFYTNDASGLKNLPLPSLMYLSTNGQFWVVNTNSNPIEISTFGGDTNWLSNNLSGFNVPLASLTNVFNGTTPVNGGGLTNVPFANLSFAGYVTGNFTNIITGYLKFTNAGVTIYVLGGTNLP